MERLAILVVPMALLGCPQSEADRLAAEGAEEETLCKTTVSDISIQVIQLGDIYREEEKVHQSSLEQARNGGLFGGALAFSQMAQFQKQTEPRRRQVNSDVMGAINSLPSKCLPRFRDEWNKMYRETGYPPTGLLSDQLPRTAAFTVGGAPLFIPGE